MTCKRPLTILLLAASLLTAACKKHMQSGGSSGGPHGDSTTNPTGPFVYLGGLIDSNNVYLGAYWKISLATGNPAGQTIVNPVYKLLPNTSRVSSIVTSGTDVYMAGTSTNSVGEYWKNDTAVPVKNMSAIAFVAVSGGNVGGIGFDNSLHLAYSTNTQESFTLDNALPTGASTIAPSGIAYQGNNVYTTANVFFLPRPIDTVQYGASGIYWSNGSPTLLTEGSAGGIYYNSTSGITTAGNDVYVTGNYVSPNDSLAWCGYWKDGTSVTLDSSRFLVTRVYANATGIAVSGADVYVSGFVVTNGVSQAVYWKDGVMTNLQGGLSTSAIILDGADVYILGQDNSGNTILWKNGAALFSFGPIIATVMAIGTN